MKKVTPKQVEKLYEFTQKHYVEYYDLQTELVDHLAHAIEAKWEKSPEVSFEDALHLEFKKFGVFGFTGIVEERQKAMSKRYRKLIWKHFKAYFTIPKVIFTLFLVVFVFSILQFSEKYSGIIYLSAFGAVIVTMAIYGIIKINKYRRKVKNTGKKWVYEEILFSTQGMIFFFPSFLSSLVNIHLHWGIDFYENFYVRFGASLFLVLFCVVNYVMLFEIPKKANEYLHELYPDYA